MDGLIAIVFLMLTPVFGTLAGSFYSRKRYGYAALSFGLAVYSFIQYVTSIQS